MDSASGENAELTKVEKEKKLALIKAWEENEKAIANSRSYKKLSEIDSWENSKKADVEAELIKIEEYVEKQKAEYAEKVKNRIAEIHRKAEEKKAAIEAQKAEDFIKVKEMADKLRSSSNEYPPKKICGCF